MLSNQKYRINNLAKDLNIKSKDIIDILTQKGYSDVTHMAVLEPDEFNLVMNVLTEKNQISDIDKYMSGKIQVIQKETKTDVPASSNVPPVSVQAENTAAGSAPINQTSQETGKAAEMKTDSGDVNRTSEKTESEVQPKRQEVKPAVTDEQRPEQKFTPKPEQRSGQPEQKPFQRQEQRTDRRFDQRPERKFDQRPEQQVPAKTEGNDRRFDQRPFQRQEPRPEQRSEQRPDQRPDQRQMSTSRPDQRPDQRQMSTSRPDQRPDQRQMPTSRPDQRPDQRQMPRPDQRPVQRNDFRNNNNNNNYANQRGPAGTVPEKTGGFRPDNRPDMRPRQDQPAQRFDKRPEQRSEVGSARVAETREIKEVKTTEQRPEQAGQVKPETAAKNVEQRARTTRFEQKPQFQNVKQQKQKNLQKTQKPQQDRRQVIQPIPNQSGQQTGVEVHTLDSNNHGSRIAGARVVDTRTSTVDLSKYDERLETLVQETAVKNTVAEKQKLKKQNTRAYDKEREKERIAFEKLKKQEAEKLKKQQLTVTIPDEILVSDLAMRLKVTASEVIKKLITFGIMATVNQTIDYDTAYLVADELGAKVSREVVVTIEERLFNVAEDKAESLVERAPVVVVMGHVDHGKTSLLDAIRHTNVTSGEAGGITQHIGAYRVNIKGKNITFLDTPGHEAFTAMRARGAKATDIAILVVAADDGIMPQTVEAINHAKAAGIDIIVAINKMDKYGANPEQVKQGLTQYNLVPEEWGGDVICVPVSAVTGMGIDSLLESVLLVAEVKELKANPNRRAKGIVIEARLDKGRGPVATVLVQNGTLNSGDVVIAGTAVGRIRAMTDDKGIAVKSAGPSVPVEIIGLSEVPAAGDEFNAVEDERMARELAEQRREKNKEEEFKSNSKVNLDDLFAQISSGQKELNIIVKADVGGSAEAVKAALAKLSTDEIKVNIIHSAVGGITEGDVMFAAASNALIVGFNVRPDKGAIDSAERHKVDIRTYRIIYECIDEIQAAMKGMLAPTFKENILGHVEVRQTIHVPNVGIIAGSYVQDGKITRSSQIRVLRDSVVICEDKIGSLRRFKDDVREVSQGFECGIGLEKFNDVKIGDIFEVYEMEELKKE